MRKVFRENWNMYYSKLNSRENLALILVVFLAITLLAPTQFVSKVQAPVEDPWWNTDWQYRKPVEIDNTLNTNALTDYQVAVSLDAGSLISAGKMKSDLSDVRFVDSDGSAVLDYWIESKGTLPQPASPDVINWKRSSPFDLPLYGYVRAVHPKVLYFPAGEGGYKYWMFYEPYTTTEVTALVRSNDGLTWTDQGVTNPILGLGPAGSFDSYAAADPDVVKVGGTWYLFYCGANSDGPPTAIGLATSTNGLTWTKYDREPDGIPDPVLRADTSRYYESADSFVSPTAYHDGSRFWLWLCSGQGTANTRVMYVLLFSCVDPTNSASWTRENSGNPVMSPTGWEAPSVPGGIWHIEVTKHGSEFWLYYAAPGWGTNSIGFARSTDMTNWAKSLHNPILTPVPGTWEASLYRASVIEVGNEIWLYYSGYEPGRIGLAKALPSPGAGALFRVEVPSIPAASTKTIYMYYGNPSATPMSSGDNTFTFFDDFNDNSLNPAKWKTGSGSEGAVTPIGTVSETNQHLEINLKSSTQNTWIELYAKSVNSYGFSNGLSFRVFMENLYTDGRGVVIYLSPESITNGKPFSILTRWIRFMILDGSYYLQIRYAASPANPVDVKIGSTTDLNRVVEIQITNTKLRLLLDGTVWQDWYTHSLTWNSAYLYLDQATGSATSRVTVHDDAAIRKYVSPEPTAEAGSEETRTCTITSCDSYWGPKDEFVTAEDLYVDGTGYQPLRYYNIYVVTNKTWSNSDPIQSPIVSKNEQADESGRIRLKLWGKPLTLGKYDIIVDVDGNMAYDAGVDAVDDAGINAGFFVIPEYALGTILALAVCFAGVAAYRRSKRTRLKP